jgi:hypothetical protein
MECASCHKVLPHGAQFCPSCGTRVPEQTSESQVNTGGGAYVRTTGERNVVAGRDIAGTTVVTGDHNTVRRDTTTTTTTVDAAALKAALQELYAALGEAPLPAETRMAAQHATSTATYEGVKNDEVQPGVLEVNLKQAGAALQQANVAVEQGSKLWASVQKLAPILGPALGVGAHAVAGWFGVPL